MMHLNLKQPFAIVAATVAASTLSLLGSHAAQALSVSSGPLPTTPGVNLIDFNGLAPGTVPTNAATPIDLGDGVTLFDGVPGNRNTVTTTEFTPPVGSDGNYLKVRQTNATFSFEKPLTYFGLLWGSIDAENTIQFFNSSTTTSVSSYTGSSLASLLGFSLLPFSANLGADGTKYIEFALADIGADVDRVVLSTGFSPFEVDNVAYQAIPTPALLPGLLGMGIAALRKRKAKAVEG
ncbi:MAG: PTPA-CTERM sorting domain-containing protein [Stenomitos rutilans HA7619-LM2]|jgi:hypothetical protein|nr:PTPA-CTERM sorting domain-containing protein [Stenomitos rutilans HA7619-LM2]